MRVVVCQGFYCIMKVYIERTNMQVEFKDLGDMEGVLPEAVG